MTPRDKAHDRRMALHLIVHYICSVSNDKDKLKSLAQVYEGAGLTKFQFDGIWTHKAPNEDNEIKLRGFILRHLKEHSVVYPDWMINILQCAFPREHSYVDYINIFSSCASRDDGFIDEIAKAYNGVYTLYRYASNISVRHNSNDARVIRAAMRIRTEKSSRWPVFSIKFNPHDRYEHL